MRITSVTNPRIKELVRLRTDSAARRESGLFCVESLRELHRAQARGFKIEEVYHCPELLRGELHAGPVVEVSEPVLRKLAYRENPEGFVAVLRSPSRTLNDVRWDGRELLIVCSGVEKPGNIGAILRSADAAGITAVLIDSPTFDLYNPNCIRSSTGAVFSMTVVCTDRPSIAAALRDHGVRVIAATPQAPNLYTQADLRPPCAIVLGAEAAGLDPFWRDTAELAVQIPQRGSVDSLNVSVTAALLMFEAVRQRTT